MKNYILYFTFLISISSAIAQSCVVGSYTGTGFALTISGIGFQPDAVLVKAVTAKGMYMKNSSMPATSSVAFSSMVNPVTTAITGFNSDGFTLGTNADVNTNGTTYYFYAFKAGTSIQVGTYTGTGTNQNINSGSLQAGYTLAVSDHQSSTGGYVFYTADGTSYVDFYDMGAGNYGGAGYHASGAPANGFTAMSNGNINTYKYYYISFINTTGTCQIGGYTGNGSDNRNITLTGTTFQPQLVMVSWYKVAVSLSGFEVMRSGAYGATDKAQYFDAISDASNLIQAFNNDGFQVGSNSSVNNSSQDFVYVAMGGGDVTVLPVELLNFSSWCMKDTAGVKIHWTTATEFNNNYFTLERSSDGFSFRQIATVKGAGNSSQIMDYNFTDNEAESGTPVYYRLNQTDYNGRTETFQIINTDCDQTPSGLSLMVIQDPVQQATLLYNMETNRDGMITLEVIDSKGSVVINTFFFNRKGLNRYELPLTNLNSGVYYIHAANRFSSAGARFIKQ